MKVELDRLDLLPEHEGLTCSKTRFEHFKPQAQMVIRSAGKAVFWTWNRLSYNAIYSDKEKRE